jgi:hypothetical protein
MEDNKIQEKVVELAHQLEGNQQTFTRADLAYELKDLGVEKDSIDVSRIVYEAYDNTKDEAIAKSFVNNENKRTLVEEYKLNHAINSDDSNLALTIIKNELSDIDKLAKRIDDLINLANSNFDINSLPSSIMSRIIGTKGATDIQKEAGARMEGYSQMISCYKDMKQNVGVTINDFVNLRAAVDVIYRKYANLLLDTFGDSIKQVLPEMFNFDSLEWMDVDSMNAAIQLEYDSLMKNCTALIADITTAFGTNLTSAASQYKSTGGGKAGLLLAGVAMYSHYTNASQRTMQMKGELITLKGHMHGDSVKIKGDMGRIMVIHKQLNDIFIPEANAFNRYSEQVISKEMKQLNDTLYSSPEIKEMNEKRSQLLSNKSKLIQAITDNQHNIEYYSNHIKECQSTLDSINAQYEEAKSKKPSSPFFLFNLFTFGALGRAYSRNLCEWKANCGPVIDQYETLTEDMKLDTDELNNQKTELSHNQSEFKETDKEVMEINALVKNKIKVDNDLKQKIANHLESIVKLLHLGKDIISNKIDDKYVHCVNIKDPEKQELPAEMRSNLQQYVGNIQGLVPKAQSLINEAYDARREKAAKEGKDTSKIDMEETMVNTGAMAVGPTLELLSAYGKLKDQKASNKILEADYDKQFEALKSQFNKDMQKIDDKSALLRNILSKINTSSNADQLKEGLCMLADLEGAGITKDKLDAFLSGNGTIEI